MRLSRSIAGLVLIVAPIGIATSVRGADGAERVEIARIRAHFDSVLTELRAQHVSSLSVAQRANRERLIVTLAAYRDRGVFPHNYDFADRAMPYFIDRKTGTLCAVAHLLESTGRRDIVDRVARANNNVWVAELAGDTELAAWLDLNGITLTEAARIQVPYVAPVSPAEQARNVAFVAVAPAAVAVAAVTTVWNAASNSDGHRRGVSWSGLAAGAVTSAAGFLVMKSPNAPKNVFAIGAATTMLGGLSILTSTQSMYRHGQIANAEREAERRRAVTDATLSPLVGFDRSQPTVGAALSLRF